MKQKLTPKNKIIVGYKATDENLCCNGFQFKIGEWYKHEGELELCKSGFHFCEYPSGPWAYYNKGRLFKIEAKEVLISSGPGADLKHVSKHIKLIEEIKIDEDGNTGDGNTGYRNTGDGNTGNGNTGYRNAGYRNTGDGNTGNGNTGDGNTGYRNTGDGNTGYRNAGDGNTGCRNAGYRNTGYRNAGDGNTGDRNTGDRNVGDRNVGDGNCGDNFSGYLNFGTAKFFIFNEETNKNEVDFNLVSKLARLLQFDDDIDPGEFLKLPNATKKKIKELHTAHKNARKEKGGKR